MGGRALWRKRREGRRRRLLGDMQGAGWASPPVFLKGSEPPLDPLPPGLREKPLPISRLQRQLDLEQLASPEETSKAIHHPHLGLGKDTIGRQNGQIQSEHLAGCATNHNKDEIRIKGKEKALRKKTKHY